MKLSIKSRLDKLEKMISVRHPAEPDVILRVSFVGAKDGCRTWDEKPATPEIRASIEKDIAEQRAAGKKVVMALVPVGYHL